MGDFLSFADYFFDGVVADWLVQSKISDARRMVWDVADDQGIRLKPPMTDKLHKASGTLTRESIEEIVTGSAVKNKETDGAVRLRLPNALCEQYFSGMDMDQMTAVVTMALAAWFRKKKSS